MLLSDFNALSAIDAATVVRVWAAVPGWVDGIVARRPYGTVDELADAATFFAASWNRADLDAALAQHPRIGERVSTTGAEADASRREQASMAHAASRTTVRIAAGNTAYEQRFGRVFLIRAAGRTPEELLGELERRLTSDSDAEASEALGQLAEIALLRLRGTVSEDERVRS